MQKHLRECLWLLCIVFSTTMFAQANVLEPTKGVLRVKLQQEVATQVGILPASTRNGIVATGIEPFDVASQKVKAVKMERVFPYVEKMEAKARKHGLHLWYEIRFDESVNAAEAMRIFSNVPGVVIAENIVPMQFLGSDNFTVVSPEIALSSADRTSEMPFNDPFLSRQWHYNNDGSLSGSIKGADANIFAAWEIATGNKDLIVAIIDGGIDYTHPDLEANICINEVELNGAPGMDNDKNGYVGDIYGFNFVLNSGDVSPHSHGTHVAGTVGAVNNNGIGVAGIAGGNGQGGVKLLSCQVFDSRSSAQGDFAKAFYYAAVRGAALAQCSWGWATSGYYEQAVVDAVKFFTAEAECDFMKGGLAIFANGNTGTEGDFYPACMDEVVAVGSMTCDLKPAPYSSYGNWVDITAPGGYVDVSAAQGVYSTLPSGQYGYSDGTSMACPHVSGIAALVLSKYGNPNFPNETLRQQLITSVNDFYTSNPSVEGKYGSGYIDAWKAMQMGSGTAPQPVTDFTMTPGQDNIYIEWIVPAAEANNVNYHLIYYSTTPFTADNLAGIPQKRVDTKFNVSGDAVSYEVDGLLPTTTYYLAIRAIDRWGNAAEISPVKSATTNAGPKMELNKTSLNIALDATQSLVAQDAFVISNTDEGLLKWSATANTVSVKASSNLTANDVRRPGKVVAYNGKISAIPASAAYPVVSADYFTENYPETLSYYSTIAAYLGDSDLSLTNSCAQWFYIDASQFPNGFNLTHLNYEGFNGSNPIIKIYDGNYSIQEETLLLEEADMYFWRGNDLALSEQLFFEPGNAFWVVTHFPAGQTNPLGAGLIDNYRTAYSYYSSNMGENWTLLSETLRDGNLSHMADEVGWSITAKSKNPDWSDVITLTPPSGMVLPGAQQEVKLSNDGQVLVNGTYKFKLTLTTNEATNAKKTVPVTFTVTGNKPELKTAKVVDFGDLLMGQSKTLALEIVNNGYGSFVGNSWGSLGSNNIKCTSDQFEVPTYTNGFPARATSTMEITFNPKVSGSHSGTITFTDMLGNSHSLVVRGIADEPAKIQITPASFDLGDLEIEGESKEVSFTINNEGKYPLEYVFPKFSNESVETTGESSHKFGYTYKSNLNWTNGFEYDNNPELVNPVKINDQFGDYDYWSDAIPLGFTFPYYGKEYDKVYISTYGAVAMENNGAIHSCIPPSASVTCIGGYGLITMYGMNPVQLSPESRIEYAYQDGKFYVKYINVLALVSFGNYTPVSFHMTLAPNGDVEFFYDDLYPYMLFEGGASLFVGLNDIPVQDPLTVTDADCSDKGIFNGFMPGSAIKFTAPGKMMVQSISAPAGVIGIGESKEIIATIKATEGMYAGELNNSLVVINNDPSQSAAFVSFKANIIGESLQPIIELEKDAIDFGNVFRTSIAKSAVLIKNTGTDILTIDKVVFDNTAFTTDTKLPIEIKPGTSKDIMVTLATNLQASYDGKMTITAGDASEHVVALTGIVIGVPDIRVTPNEIVQTIGSGSPLATNITIQNTGDETLNYSFIPNSMYSISSLDASETSSVNYIYSASVNDESVLYDWDAIENTDEATHLKLSYWLYHDYVEVELPYEINYYGNKYDKIYVYGVGFVSFNKVEDYNEAPTPPSTIPSNETLYTNFIAPYWGHHFMDQTNTGGVYYSVKEDRVVVSFMEYGNSVNYGVCYQLIMYRNGKFKFQYKLANEYSYWDGIYGVAGMQNDAATEGILLPNRCLAMNNAVEFYPVKSESILQFERSTVNVSLDTDRMAGNYQANIVLNTNIPTKPTVEIPVNLTITGEPVAVFPTEVTHEAVTGSTSGTGYLEIPFEISNSGTAAFVITDVDAPGMIGYEATVGMLFYYGTYFDDWTWTERVGWSRYIPGTEIVVGKEPAQFKVMVIDNYTIADYAVPMTFSVNGLETSTVDVPFKLSITDAPFLMFADAETRVSGVEANYRDQVDIMFGNIGNYKLNYTIELDPTGEGADDAVDAGGGSVMPLANKQPSVMSEKFNELLVATEHIAISSAKSTRATSIDLPSDFSYNKALYHPIMPGTTQMYIVGSFNKQYQFQSATQFTAPADGFNLHSIYTHLTIGDLTNVEVIADIIQGSDINTGEVIGTGKLFIEKETPAGYNSDLTPYYTGDYHVLTLDREIYMNANETFYVRFTYPKGYEYSTGLVNKEESIIADRYLYNIESEWYDAALDMESNYGSTGYIMTCLEVNEGEEWIRLLTTDKSGSLEPYDLATVTVELNASAARLDKNNKAVLVLRSNDPTQPVVNYPIYLDKNGAPDVAVPSNIYVKEGVASTITIGINDADCDSYEVKINDANGIASIESYSAKGYADVTITRIDDTTIRVVCNDNWVQPEIELLLTLNAEYGQAGNRSFDIVATDDAGNSSTTSVAFYVEHVNRAPIAVAYGDLELTINSTTQALEFADMFQDPDGDELSYTLKVSESGIVEIFSAGESIILMGKKIGETIITVTATDKSGASATNTFKVTVNDGTGIADMAIDGAVTVYPNPVVDNANITINADVQGEVTYKVYNTAGTLMHAEIAVVAASGVHTIDMSGYVAGVYYLEIEVNGAKTTVSIVKK